jgi:hypothetical protein
MRITITEVLVAVIIFVVALMAWAAVRDEPSIADAPGQYIGARRVSVGTLPDGTRCAVVQTTGSIDCDWAPRQAEAAR